VEYVREMLALAEGVGLTFTLKQIAKGSEWPGPKNLPVKVRRYVTLGLRDGFGCAYCAAPLPIWAHTVDHVVPRSRGGGNGADNLVLACQPCNSSKGRRLLEEWRAA
jgi:5-methylcytosine-specific restriction endonuclease McrA